jgi:hypothetical protein
VVRTLTKSKGRRTAGNFLLVPERVIRSENYRKLSMKAKALLLDMGAQYNGHNNGDLSAAWSDMKKFGWRSKDTLHNARVELVYLNMTELTRQGGMHGPSLYAYTWLPISECSGKLDVPSTRVASGKWNRPPTLPSSSNARRRDAHPDKRAQPPRQSGQPEPNDPESAPIVGPVGIKLGR